MKKWTKLSCITKCIQISVRRLAKAGSASLRCDVNLRLLAGLLKKRQDQFHHWKENRARQAISWGL